MYCRTLLKIFQGRWMSKREIGIDLLKSIAILYIVGFWHLLDYAPVIKNFHTPLWHLVTWSMLALFVFISGYLSYNSFKRKGTRKFLLDRFLRIYPLYFFAALGFYLVRIYDVSMFLKAISVTGMFWTPAPLTLWFISMLIVYIIMTPLFLTVLQRYGTRGFIGISVTVFILLYFLKWKCHIDERLPLYFWAYILGMYVAFNGKFLKYQKPLFLWGGIFMIFYLFLFFQGLYSWTLSYIPLVTLLAFFFFSMGKGLELRYSGWIVYIATASYCMYLFHRLVYTLFTWIYVPSSVEWRFVFYFCIGLPIIVMSSYLIQRSYDKVIGYLYAKN